MIRLLTHARVEETYGRVTAEKFRRRGIVEVSGIMSKHTLKEKRVVMELPAIREMLAELPEGFHAPAHRGWSIGKMILDKDGVMWTTEFATVEKLVVLGIAAKLGRFCVEDRAKWAALPLGMPYYVVELSQKLVLQ